ncbi:tRNA threonylcarbamoyladenosine dehydratase, partial [Pseudomonas aeruginosa]
MQVDEQRFGGIGRLYGREGLQRLADSHVAVVGIGGVGSWAAEALARSGVGEISLFDLDDVCVTNTNRQV